MLPLPRADLNLTYDIPVFATGENSTISAPTSDSHPELAEQHQQEFDELANIQRLPDGVSLNFGYFRRVGACIAGLVFGAIFGGAGIFIGTSGGPIFMAGIFATIGSLIGLGSLYVMLNRYHVKLGARGIYTERFLLGLRISKSFTPPSRIRHLAIAENGSSQSGNTHTEFFVINAILHGSDKIRVAESITGRIAAEQALAKISELSGIAVAK